MSSNVFKFRAELLNDVGVLLQRITATKVEIEVRCFEDGIPSGECEVTLTGPYNLCTPESGRKRLTPMNLAELRAVMAAISDGHVMVETVALLADYTGERDYQRT